jgi:hypothetical protein
MLEEKTYSYNDDVDTTISLSSLSIYGDFSRESEKKLIFLAQFLSICDILLSTAEIFY